MKTHYQIYLWTISLLLFAITSSLFAQDSTVAVSERSGGMYFGLGMTSVGIAGGAGYFLSRKQHIFTLRLTTSTELGLFDDHPKEDFWDVGVLYGWSHKKKFFATSLSIGISMVWGTRRGAYIGPGGFLAGDRYEANHFKSMGFPLQVQFFLTPLPLLGIGISGIGNVNAERLIWGVLICLQFGKL